MEAVKNQKVNRNHIWEKLVYSGEVPRNGMKLLGGSGWGIEEGTLEKFEREQLLEAKEFKPRPISGSSVAGGF